MEAEGGKAELYCHSVCKVALIYHMALTHAAVEGGPRTGNSNFKISNFLSALWGEK